jgi:hypothetical protein
MFSINYLYVESIRIRLSKRNPDPVASTNLGPVLKLDRVPNPDPVQNQDSLANLNLNPVTNPNPE